jgi:aspartate carbamoyltransferase regulatory subunit
MRKDIKSGLNLVVVCENINCLFFKLKYILNLGYTVLTNDTKVKCVYCQQLIKDISAYILRQW